MTQFHITLPQFLISEGQKQKTSILVSTVEASCSLAFWTKIHRSMASFCSRKISMHFPRKVAVPLQLLEWHDHNSSVHCEVNCKAQGRGQSLRYPPTLTEGHSAHWKDFPTVWHLSSCRWRFPLHFLSLTEKQLHFARSVCHYIGWNIPMKCTTKRSTSCELHTFILWQWSFIPYENRKPSFLWLPCMYLQCFLVLSKHLACSSFSNI